MFLIDGLCPTQNLGGYGFTIYLSSSWEKMVSLTSITQDDIDRLVKTFGNTWAQSCGMGSWFDPDNCGLWNKKGLVPSSQTTFTHNIRLKWGRWGLEHISVPGNACGLDIDLCCLGSPFDNSVGLVPHNIDNWGQVNLILVIWSYFSNLIMFNAKYALEDQDPLKELHDDITNGDLDHCIEQHVKGKIVDLSKDPDPYCYGHATLRNRLDSIGLSEFRLPKEKEEGYCSKPIEKFDYSQLYMSPEACRDLMNWDKELRKAQDD